MTRTGILSVSFAREWPEMAELVSSGRPLQLEGFIGMLHVPVNTILAAPPAWRGRLPSATAADWRLFDVLEKEFGGFLRPNGNGFFGIPDDSEQLANLEDAAGRFSFCAFLEERLAREAELYDRYGVAAMMLENVAAPYFTRQRQPVAVAAVVSRLAGRLRRRFPDRMLGLQVLAFSDDLALVIAARHGFRFIRSETGLFAGLRPEGPTPNQGNLAVLYAWRNRWQARQPASEPPLIYVDLRKKHTFFPGRLADLDFWFNSLGFQKIEGVILTGPATGRPVDGDELRRLRQAVDQLPDVRPALLVGSGVTPANLPLCRRFADGVIVGSSLKKDGFWENPLDEERLRRFAECWRAGDET